MILQLNRESRIPLYVQIASQVRELIAAGRLKIGDRLPANRELARSLDVNRTTVTTAYADLEADGLICSEVGRGTFVAAIPANSKSSVAPERTQPSPMLWNALLVSSQRDVWLGGLLHSTRRKGTISLAHGLPQAELFPLEDFRRSVDRVLRREGRELLQLGTSSGYAPLQEYLTSQLALSGINIGPDEILITNGCQQTLDLVRRIFVGPGDEIIIEEPTYPGAISVFCANNTKYTSIPVGRNGMDLDVLEDVLSQRRPKLIYTVPTYHNPTGVTMDLAARRRLIDLAIKHRVPVIEDDIYRELHYEGPMLPSLKALDRHGVVISMNSFSKIGFPGLRVGWVAAPQIVIEQLSIAKQNCDLHASLLTQAAIYEFSRHGLLAKHIKRVKKAYAHRRDAMLDALEKYFPQEARWNRPEGGMAIWVKLPEPLTAGEVLIHSVERGVVFSPGEHFYSGPPHQNMMRLCFTIASPEMIEEAVKRLGAVIKERMSSLKKRPAVHRAEGVRALV
ncbi:MAG TPA: PLP-dependent aminotransferase family protein [Blastocatellia bacterium]|nr:PLP-dependent aminotransferase family protein [Blastocatellia bacterium]